MNWNSSFICSASAICLPPTLPAPGLILLATFVCGPHTGVVRRKFRPLSQYTAKRRLAKRGLARISPLLRNSLPVPGLPGAGPYSAKFAMHSTSETARSAPSSTFKMIVVRRGHAAGHRGAPGGEVS